MTPLAWGRFDSPLGRLHLGVSDAGLARILLPSEDPGQVELTDGGTVELVRRELEQYFAGERLAFTLALDWSSASGFRLRALEAMSQIPYGETVTYAELAAGAGNPRAARAAGHACATNPIPIVLPCHRVIGSDGGLHGYTGGLHHKRFLLELEGAL